MQEIERLKKFIAREVEAFNTLVSISTNFMFAIGEAYSSLEIIDVETDENIALHITKWNDELKRLEELHATIVKVSSYIVLNKDCSLTTIVLNCADKENEA